jgi:hypothetical protein
LSPSQRNLNPIVAESSIGSQLLRSPDYLHNLLRAKQLGGSDRNRSSPTTVRNMVTRKPVSPNPSGLWASPGPPNPAQHQALHGASNDSWGEEPVENAWHNVGHDAAGYTADYEPPSYPPPKTSNAVNAQYRNEPDFNDESDHNVWDEARRQPASEGKLNSAPDVLRPGTDAAGATTAAATNPFRRKPVAADEVTSEAPPAVELPTQTFSRLDLDDQSNNPWAPPVNAPPRSDEFNASQPVLTQERDPWADDRSTHQAMPVPPKEPQELAASPPALIFIPSEEGSAWGDDSRTKTGENSPVPPMGSMSEELIGSPSVWDDLGSVDKGKGKATGPIYDDNGASIDDWNLIDAESPPSPSKQPTEEPLAAEPPPLPARNSDEQARWVPTRVPVDSKAETYQVKNIRWHDPSSRKNPRTSPILVQNENGPCPLVALVNALSLTTPADVEDTGLVHVLRSREQVTLNLILDAVFDELMSARRTGAEVSLPDVGDLYAFLQSLHTGMNVNPRFIPAPAFMDVYKTSSLTDLEPEEREHVIPGTFENTQEMALYATFSIPLIHGWLPPRSEAVYAAMERQAVSYEDVQNLLFREEELEDKLSDASLGLSVQEQQLYQDIILIKSFLDMSATQLTPYGINVIGKSMRPGSFAILFRNDHFSTLYCHPHTKHLLTLVTDAGYRGHDEVVWESLVDVNGEHAQFLSGDFRVVGGAGAAAGPSNLGMANYSVVEGNDDWTTVQGKRGKSKQPEMPDAGSTAPLSAHEQADRDLALALQLQEEEDQRQRDHEAQRQKETRLSEQFIEQQGHHRPTPVQRGQRDNTREGADIAPARRSSNSVNVPVTTTTSSSSQPPSTRSRPAIPPRRQGQAAQGTAQAQAENDAPPSYEQAAAVPAYEPPMGHPNHESASHDIARQATRSSVTSRGGPSSRPPPGWEAANRGATSVRAGQSRDKECVLM